MPKKRVKRNKTGLPPGSVIFTGKQKVDNLFFHYCIFNASSLEEKIFLKKEDIIFEELFSEKIQWYDLRGLHFTELIESIGKQYNLHSLTLEDAVDVNQRPKFEEYEENIFLITRALSFDKSDLSIKTEQVVIFIKAGLLISFQESEGDLFSAIRDRLKNSKGKIRKRGADYLAYALIDNIVDNYFIVLDEVENAIEELEDKLLTNPDQTIKERIHHLKKELLVLRKSVSPLREAISRFSKSDHDLIGEDTPLFTRNLYDHTIQIMDMIDTYRDTLNGLQDLYLSEISFKMNQVMQVLTIVTTIFVPLSFLAGLYGMNFVNIPELGYQYGYYILLGVMAIILLGSLYLFKKKGWL